MAQQQYTSSSWRLTIYRIAKWAWIVTAGIWTGIIIAFLVQFIPNLLTTSSLSGTLAERVFQWFRASNLSPLEVILRTTALGIIVLLVVIPILAFVFKQVLQNVEPEGFNKLAKVQEEGVKNLIDVLQQDTISPQLDLLQERLERQLQKQDASIDALKRIFVLLQKELTHIIQDRTSKQEQDIQETVLNYLQHISSLLEQIQDRLKHLSSSETSSLTDWRPDQDQS